MKSGTSRHSASRGESDQDPEARSGSTDAAAPGASDADGRRELVDATQYDLDRLDRAIRELVLQQRDLTRENEALRGAVSEREARVSRLEGELESSENRRRLAIGKVDALIDELDRLDAALDRSMVDSARQVPVPASASLQNDDAAG